MLVSGVAVAEEPAPAPDRYRIVFSPHNRGEAFLLDSATGRVWQLVVYPDRAGNSSIWEWMDRVDNWDQMQVFFAEHPKNNPAPANPAPKPSRP
jgi:hypothetical protein